jgi:dephospho-CoA kinase
VNDRRTLRIGVTGPIGCGKSTVAGWLAELGADVVDADVLARDVTAPGEPALALVVARFGREFLRPDGTLDRPALGRLVFENPAALADLERIVHPAVRARIAALVAEAEAAGRAVLVVEAIKLVEGGLAAECDEVWLVACSPAEQRVRLAERGLAPADAGQRIAAQADLVARLRPHATRIIDTGGSLAEARRRVDAALEEALAMAAQGEPGA